MIDLGFSELKQTLVPWVDKALQQPGAELEAALQSVLARFQPAFGFDEKMKERLLQDLRTSYNTTASMPAVLKDPSEYEPWLEARRDKIEWRFWDRYRFYLSGVKGWSPNVVKSLHETTDEILDLLADPCRTGQPFERLGLVMGYVQSGKTANFTALINKALDAGFKVIIVLSGLHNNLRSQTQLRLDEEVMGYTMSSTQRDTKGVGLLKGYATPPITPLTHFGDLGDFAMRRASVAPPPPILLVVKKNKSILTNLLNYFRKKFKAGTSVQEGTNNVQVDLPMLMIDDEADQASVNTSDIYDEDDKINPEYDPSTINGLIRDVFQTFAQRAYVGYTATPFANMFIDRNSETKQFGRDLFPRDFIIGLPKPSNYVGPAEYFSLNDDPENQEPGLVRHVTQDAKFLPPNHKKGHVPGALPGNLVDSIYTYLLATALRRLRGQEKRHSSMLVHVTRYTAVQHQVFELVQEKVAAIRSEIRHGYGKTAHDDRLRQIYETDFIPTSAGRQDRGDTFDWETVRAELPKVLQKVQVREINGESADVLNYSEHKDGLYVLAVGGDKLSRGLTLDDLVVSYYLRTSKMYDTLMQMGRWFGYRDGYLDLCRVFTTEELATQFYHIAVATESLRAQLEDMAERGETPEEYVLQINAHPDLKITSPNKMQTAVLVKESFSARNPQTVVFDNKKAFFARNFAATERFIAALGAPGRVDPGAATPIVAGTSHYVWTNVSCDAVVSFLMEYETSPHGTLISTSRLLDYVLSRRRDGELTKWTVVILNSGNESDRTIAGLTLLSGVTRKGEEYDRANESFNIRILTSGNHEFLDFTEEKWKEAQALLEPDDGKKANKENLKKKVRGLRDPQNGLLLIYPLATEGDTVAAKAREVLELTNSEIPIGISISFPESQKAKGDHSTLVNRSVLSEG